MNKPSKEAVKETLDILEKVCVEACKPVILELIERAEIKGLENDDADEGTRNIIMAVGLHILGKKK